MKKILISESPWQTKVAITNNNKLQNIYFSPHTIQTLEKAFFKGIVTKILPGIQTAFVDIGQERSGFLHISEIDHELAIEKMNNITPIEEVYINKTESMKKDMDISKILQESENILVQVSKEPVYEKGAKLTTCFTLPGRFIVLMPNIPRIGVSKKIENQDERKRLKDIILKWLPNDMGAILRTNAENRTEKELIREIKYLANTWRNIQKKYISAKTKEIIYEDIPLYLQAVRDHLDNDVEEIVTNNKNIQNQLYKFVQNIAPEFTLKIKYYQEPPSLFDYYQITSQIDEALKRKVTLKSGGSIIIETTEAMTVIDVNTGSYSGSKGMEDTILKTNMDAAEEIVRQLRLRNIGGLIVIDFIDMVNPSNRQKLSKFLEKTLKEQDKFQSVVLRISEFGLVQMTRKRSGKTLIQQLMETCKTCKGIGVVKSIKTKSFHILQKIKEKLLTSKKGGNILITINSEIFDYISTIEYNSILQLEKKFQCKITLKSSKKLDEDKFELEII